MVHTFYYMGRFDLNYLRLLTWPGLPRDFQYVRDDGTSGQDKWRPVTGIVFGYMERNGVALNQGRVVVVSVNDKVLTRPIDLNHARHTGGSQMAPTGPNITDEQANNLLYDLLLRT